MTRGAIYATAPVAVGENRFPGFGEGAPLNLAHVSDDEFVGIRSRFEDHSMGSFTDAAARVGNCVRPVRLNGHSLTVDRATGEVLGRFDAKSLPLAVLYRPCGNRRETVCAPCSRVYARDTFEMVRAGLLGGKTVSSAVAENPLLFLTVTAPSFGHVHGQRCGPDGPLARVRVCSHGRRNMCEREHGRGDRLLGSPLCWECYDWNSSVIWQWWAPELWRRTCIAMRRALARELGIPERRLQEQASLQFAKVAETQVRGLIHFHALIRLDGPSGPGSAASLPGHRLGDLIGASVRAVEFNAPAVDNRDTKRRLSWGRQLDVRVVRNGRRTDDPLGPLVPAQVAGYLAKYATKDASAVDVDGRPPPHLVEMRRVVKRLAARAHVADQRSDAPYALLGKWAHMYGFRGHFASKSRRYSITLGMLRRARQRFARMVAAGEHPEALDPTELEARLLADEDDTTLVVGFWAFQGAGWPRPGDEALALSAAARAREHSQWRAQRRTTTSRTTTREGE